MDSKHSDFPAQKIASPELARMAAEDSCQEASVLIELNLPPQQVHAKRQPSASQGAQWSFLEESAEVKETNRRTIEAASHSLQTLLGETPRWLNSARAFVARVTPEQLRIISRFPFVKAVHSNRRISAKP